MHFDSIFWTIAFWAGVFVLAASSWSYVRNRPKSKENWLLRSGKVTSKCSLIAGTWAGAYEYHRNFGAAPLEADQSFRANLSCEDGFFAGTIVDSLGDAEINGISEYPNIHFKKTYLEVHSERASRETLLYAGQFESQNVVSGEWRAESGNIYGGWRMERVVTDSKLWSGEN